MAMDACVRCVRRERGGVVGGGTAAANDGGLWPVRVEVLRDGRERVVSLLPLTWPLRLLLLLLATAVKEALCGVQGCGRVERVVGRGMTVVCLSMMVRCEAGEVGHFKDIGWDAEVQGRRWRMAASLLLMLMELLLLGRLRRPLLASLSAICEGHQSLCKIHCVARWTMPERVGEHGTGEEEGGWVKGLVGRWRMV